MRIKRVTGEDNLEVESLTGIAGSLPFTFNNIDPDGTVGDPLDISGITPRVEVTTGPPDNPGSVVVTFAESGGTAGCTITRDDPTGTFTVAMTDDAAAALAVADYSFRFLFFEGSECTDRPFYGRWLHRKGR